MKTVRYIVFRYLTDADFFNIYKPRGTEIGGGGQSYIDFKTSYISHNQWYDYFSGVENRPRTQGPSWTFNIHSIGLNSVQSLTIYQRRPQSFTISSQKITSRESNRVLAWHPNNGFPKPNDPTNRTSCPPKLAIYIVRTTDEEFWAGWFQNNIPCKDNESKNMLSEMLPDYPEAGHVGFIDLSEILHFDETDIKKPFFKPISTTISTQPKVATPSPPRYEPLKKIKPKIKRTTRTDEEITKSLFDEDDNFDSEPKDKLKEVIVKVRNRNAKAIQGLKELYKGKCQITGNKFTFTKKDGKLYCEAHHLIPLVNEGADSPYNIIIRDYILDTRLNS